MTEERQVEELEQKWLTLSRAHKERRLAIETERTTRFALWAPASRTGHFCQTPRPDLDRSPGVGVSLAKVGRLDGVEKVGNIDTGRCKRGSATSGESMTGRDALLCIVFEMPPFVSVCMHSFLSPNVISFLITRYHAHFLPQSAHLLPHLASLPKQDAHLACPLVPCWPSSASGSSIIALA